MEDGIGYQLPSSLDVDKDELFVCPYDPVHRISSKRFVYHLIKCKKQHPHIETATCPFNARHVVLKPDIRYHTSICPDKRLIELEMSKLDLSELPDNQPVTPEVVLDFQTDEDWGKEIDEAEERANQISRENMMSSGTMVTKKLNSRREAIKKMKEEMRQKALQKAEDMQYEIRRPFHSPDVVNLGSSFRGFPSKTVDYCDFTKVPYPLSSFNPPLPLSARPGAKLAANFASVGRGRFIQESTQNGLLETPKSYSLASNGLLQPTKLCVIGEVKSTNCNEMMRQDVLSNISELMPQSGNNMVDPGKAVDWGNDGLLRREKKLMKLLKQIHTLEQKLSSGVKLQREEQQKMERKREIEEELENVKRSIAMNL